MPRTVVYNDPLPESMQDMHLRFLDGRLVCVKSGAISRPSSGFAPSMTIGVELREEELPQDIIDAIEKLKAIVCGRAMEKAGFDVETQEVVRYPQLVS